MPRTPFDRVTPEYRNAIPGNHWMGVCHPYFIPNQPPPEPCGCCGPVPPPPTPGHRAQGPLLDRAPVPCGMVGDRPKPVVDPLGNCVPVEIHPLVSRPNPFVNPVDYDSNTQAPHPKIYWLAKRDVSVVAGENADVQEVVDPSTGDKTYVVSAESPAEDRRRIDALERQLEAELAEIRRIKANMLTVDEDGDNGVEFGLGME